MNLPGDGDVGKLGGQALEVYQKDRLVVGREPLGAGDQSSAAPPSALATPRMRLIAPSAAPSAAAKAQCS